MANKQVLFTFIQIGFIKIGVFQYPDFVTDLDECKAGNRPSGQCGDNAICTNTEGFFTCVCPPGFSGNAYKKCLGKCSSLPPYFLPSAASYCCHW